MPDTEWRAPIPKEERNYPMNCWWVAAFCEDVGEDLSGKWLLNTPVVLYRDSGGNVVALEDRCPHRAAPLSKGNRRGDNVECIYHGFTFGKDGKCVRVPSLRDRVPDFRVRSFQVIEKAPFVWIYLGDPAKIDDVPPPPDYDWWNEESFAHEKGYLNVAGNYMLLKENVLDLTHFGFVHANSFKITDWVDPPKLVGSKDNPGFSQTFKASPLPPIFSEPLGVAPDKRLDRENYGNFLSPALQCAALDIYDPEKDENKEPIGKFRVLHATTPIDQTNMHYYWVIARDYGTSPEEMKAFKEITEIGFAEDEDVIEAVQAVMSRDPRESADIEVSVPADAPSVQARRAVQRWMDKETA